jgi:S-adenosylmethionine:tRNA ribosyltransferase-isomerase
MDLRVRDFDYDLPKKLIEQHPPASRDGSRMMVVERKTGRITHACFKEFPGYLRPGDVLVLNDTKVIPAKAWGRAGEKDAEFLFVKEGAAGRWEVLCRPAKRVRTGGRIVFGPGFEGTVAGEGTEGLRVLCFEIPDVLAELNKVGFAPLPPYIKRRKDQTGLRPLDLERYQTVFARKEGAIAAPTAGLHFTKAILEEMAGRGVEVQSVTLDIGVATFQPVRVDRVEDHRMLEEKYEIAPAAARAISAAKSEGRPVTAVGTTVVRTLESAWTKGGVRPGRDATSLFIYPGYEYQVVDRLLTNFHLPRSTLLMLVSAFAGRDLVMRAYREAVKERYRFFSYGDCMLIL